MASFLKQVRLSEGSETSSSSRASRRKGTSLLPEGRELVPSASFGKLHLWRFPKEAPEVPEGSNFFLNVLREASPLAAFRRKRTCFIKFHLWRGGGFPKEAPEVKLVSERPSGSFTSGGFLKEASPLALPAESFTSGGVAAFRRKRTCFRPSESFTSGGVALPSERERG